TTMSAPRSAARLTNPAAVTTLAETSNGTQAACPAATAIAPTGPSPTPPPPHKRTSDPHPTTRRTPARPRMRACAHTRTADSPHPLRGHPVTPFYRVGVTEMG